MWAIIPTWNHFFCPLRKAGPSGECTDQHMQQRSPTVPSPSPHWPSVYPRPFYCAQVLLKNFGVCQEHLFWAAHCRICSPVPLALQHFSGSLPMCRWSNPFTCCGNQEHTVKVAVPAGPGHPPGSCRKPSWKGCPQESCSLHSFVSLWHGWHGTTLDWLSCCSWHQFLMLVGSLQPLEIRTKPGNRTWDGRSGWGWFLYWDQCPSLKCAVFP